ncbi:MAG: FAD-dependent oxidoreductase, partial [Candidatus Omnitrophica bacterium]|nr:FAD-dependent oxidoreductase [Candidatus Omnitrophota bacterium]
MDNFDITIIGAGVVGLSIAQELSKIRKNIVVLEAEEKFGQGVSSRNSEVIHSGIYYPENTLKARLCVRGAELLYELCSRNSIPHRKLGKLIVAVDDSEIEAIELLFKKAKINKVKEVKILKKNEITRMEPQVRGLAAVYLPGTGIINSHALMDFF